MPRPCWKGERMRRRLGQRRAARPRGAVRELLRVADGVRGGRGQQGQVRRLALAIAVQQRPQRQQDRAHHAGERDGPSWCSPRSRHGADHSPDRRRTRPHPRPANPNHALAPRLRARIAALDPERSLRGERPAGAVQVVVLNGCRRATRSCSPWFRPKRALPGSRPSRPSESRNHPVTRPAGSSPSGSSAPRGRPATASVATPLANISPIPAIIAIWRSIEMAAVA